MLFDSGPLLLRGPARHQAIGTIVANHYLHSFPSGKTHLIGFHDCFIAWSLPANPYIGRYLTGQEGFTVWELSRLWAPDGHAPNLLTQAISQSVTLLKSVERPDLLLSYADPNAGHAGGVYKAAGWLYHGQGEESRIYRKEGNGQTVARRAFHSAGVGLTKGQIIALGYVEEHAAGKLRFIRPLTVRAKLALKNRGAAE